MMKTISLEQVVSQAEGNIATDMDGEKVMLSITNGKYYNLGTVGGEIWDLIKEPQSIIDLVHELMNRFDIDEATCKKQVIGFLSSLREENLVKINGAI